MGRRQDDGWKGATLHIQGHMAVKLGWQHNNPVCPVVHGIIKKWFVYALPGNQGACSILEPHNSDPKYEQSTAIVT